MTKKCNKYEALFTFADEATFNQHLQECEDCRLEHEKMIKISNLIKEVKPRFTNQHLKKIKTACVLFLVLTSGLTLEIANQNFGIIDTIKYGEQLTISDLGLPVDNYGLIQVD